MSDYQTKTDIRYAAARGWVDAIIAPHETREVLIRPLELANAARPPGGFRGGVIADLTVAWDLAGAPVQGQDARATGVSSVSHRQHLRLLGDSIHLADALAQDPHIDFLTLDYLAEVSMSILAKLAPRSDASYASDFLEVTRSLSPAWKLGGKFKIVTNAGGLNPPGPPRHEKILSTRV